MPFMDAVTVSEGVSEVTTLLTGVATIVTSNILYMIPVAGGFVALGIGLFRKIRHA